MVNDVCGWEVCVHVCVWGGSVCVEGGSVWWEFVLMNGNNIWYILSQCFQLGAWEYIQSTRDRVCDLERRVRLAKANVENIITIMSGWAQSPLYKRKDNKNDSLLNLDVSMLCVLWCV